MKNFELVEFKTDVIEVVDCFVSVKKLCQNLGLIDFQGQQSKIKADITYQSKIKEIEINGIIQKVLCIPYNKVNGWLFSINPSRVKPEVKQKLIEYKNECFEVLYKHFHNKPQINYQIQRENIELKRTLKRLLNNTDEIDRLKQQNTIYYEKLDEANRKLQKIKNIL